MNQFLKAGNLRTVSESDESAEPDCPNLQAPNTAPLRRKKKAGGGLGVILNWLKGDHNKKANAENKAPPIGKKTLLTISLSFCNL